MTTCVALLRGINVGRAKRIAMADLRDLVAGLGHRNVRTLLNSGNVIFEAARADTEELAREIEERIAKRCGFSARVLVITAEELEAIARSNPLREAENEPSRFLVAFVASTATLAKLMPLAKDTRAPDRLALGPRAAYLWCAGGILESRMLPAFSRLGGEEVTTRNWATVQKLQAATRA